MSDKQTEKTIQLDTPIKRGKTEITEIVLRKPQSGALRGTRLQAIMDRCSAQSDRSCGYCTGGRGAGCLEILATHHRISWWRGGRIQSGGRSRQCSIRTA